MFAALEGELPVDEANADGVEALEERVRVDPFDREARVGLVSHYSRERFGDEDMARRHAEHVLWLVEHAPRQPLHGTPAGRIYPWKNSQEYARAKALWLGHVGRAPGDVTLLGNAAAFFTSADRGSGHFAAWVGTGGGPGQPGTGVQARAPVLARGRT